MADTATLELFAEMSIGLVGFAGVVSALGRSRLPPATRAFRISALLHYGVTALGGSLLPLVLLNHGIAETTAWVASAVTLALGQVTMMGWAVVATRPLVRGEELPLPLTVTVFSIFTVVVAYLMYGIAFDRDSLPGIYLVGLSFTLGLGVFHFVMLVRSIDAGVGSDASP